MRVLGYGLFSSLNSLHHTLQFGSLLPDDYKGLNRMGDKKKKATVFIRLVSAAGTGFFYVKRKPTKVTEKLEFRKFDPRVNRHVLFTEAKMK
ncbi:hypothetical protein L3X38_002500 [Prunus dulcis]|uniref:50S ribosomal protein L33, chloroplastic n=4 Tax=Prunus TaxID=3754 RepID=A0AAD4ZL44_PRUDU|nr:hypothetical protein L3X38_002500 [Prunus dulcis]